MPDIYSGDCFGMAWYAIDRLGRVAVLSGGAVCRHVANHLDELDAIDAYIRNVLPDISKSSFARDYLVEIHRQHKAKSRKALKYPSSFTRKGIYCYSSDALDDESALQLFARFAKPETDLAIDVFPQHFQTYLINCKIDADFTNDKQLQFDLIDDRP